MIQGFTKMKTDKLNVKHVLQATLKWFREALNVSPALLDISHLKCQQTVPNVNLVNTHSKDQLCVPYVMMDLCLTIISLIVSNARLVHLQPVEMTNVSNVSLVVTQPKDQVRVPYVIMDLYLTIISLIVSNARLVHLQPVEMTNVSNVTLVVTQPKDQLRVPYVIMDLCLTMISQVVKNVKQGRLRCQAMFPVKFVKWIKYPLLGQRIVKNVLLVTCLVGSRLTVSIYLGLQGPELQCLLKVKEDFI